MDKALQDAIKVVAEYDGWVREMKATIQGFTPKWVSPDKMFSCWTDEIFFNHQEYTTSADALLPVYQKVEMELQECANTLLDPESDYAENVGFLFLELECVGSLILKLNLPEAVIKLAGIIQQLKQK